MASRAVNKVVRKSKTAVDSVIHPPYLKALIPAQQARPAPPLGPQLGKRNVNIANFCKDFNERTKDIKEGTPIPCFINVRPDRSYDLQMTHPSAVHLLRLAAAVKKGASEPVTDAWQSAGVHDYHCNAVHEDDGDNDEILTLVHEFGASKEVCGRLTLKHIYHIAELKKQDPALYVFDLEKICKMLIGTAHRLGIEVLSKEDLDSGRVDHSPEGYAKFLKERELFLEQKKKEVEEKKQAKMMRL